MTKWIHGASIVAIALLVGGVGIQVPSGQTAPHGEDAQRAGRAAGTAEPDKERAEPRVTVDFGGAWIGVSLREVGRVDADQMKLPEATGAYVRGVDPGSPAENAGLRTGDAIVEFDGERVRGARQLTRLIRETPDGRNVKVTVVRAGARQSVTLTPERRRAWTDDDMGDVMAGVDRELRDLPRHFEFDLPEPPRLGRFRAGDARLGVAVQPLTDQLAAHFGTKSGVLVSEVEEGSPAAQAGLRAGDVIATIDGRPIYDPGHLARDVRRAAGKELSIGVVRDKKPLTLKVTAK